MPQEDVELVQGFVGLWDRRDLVTGIREPHLVESALELLDPDCELRWAAESPEAQTWRGREGALQALVNWLEPWREFRMESLEFVDTGNSVVVHFRQIALGKESGIEVEMEVSHVYKVRNGRLARMFEYSSRQKALEAAALSPSP